VKNIVIVSTGGTIEKTYDEMSGLLDNEVNVLDVMLSRLQIEGVHIERLRLMNKDSLNMSEDDHTLIAATACRLSQSHDGVVVVHGTDRLTVSGDRIMSMIDDVHTPIVLTGAMRPYLLRNTDALQNLTEALLAVQLLDKGVYAVMHNKVLEFPGVEKDRELGTFVKHS
jgi:L-asparaginase